jgi:crotonobetaine/carnitine-CoA ligase
VHLALTNSPTFVAVWIATVRLGAWIVPSDPMGRTPEFADHIERTEPVVGFCAADRAEVYRAAATPDMTVIEIDEADVDLVGFGTMEFADWPAPDLTDRAAVMFTSGTTGRPKGVEITQANYAFAGKTMAEAASLGAGDRHIVVLPLFHANAQYYSFASAIWAGASVALMHTFSASGFLGQCARHQATCASLFAAPIRMILARGEATDGVALRHCWYAQNIADDQYETISGWLGCRPRQLYGMTETIPAVLTDEATAPRPDAMGYVTAGCEVEVHDAAGQPVAPDVVGEIVVRGDRGTTLFAGYLDDPATTDASFAGDWFHTGDRATVDTNGRFFFDGRRSDVLKVAGENVSTVEVESVLSAHPAVLEASVVGAPDPVRDEVPVAFVVATDAAAAPTVDELTQWCAERLGKAKVPRDITLIDELPRTSVGKIRKFVLKERVG